MKYVARAVDEEREEQRLAHGNLLDRLEDDSDADSVSGIGSTMVVSPV